MKNITSKNNFLKKVYEQHIQGIQEYIGLVDYTMLSPESTEEDIIGLCDRAIEYGVATVCVLPKMVLVAKNALKFSAIGITTVISFPDGTDSEESKISECRQAIADGADDVDMVLNYQKLINGVESVDDNLQETEELLIDEVLHLSQQCHNAGKILKVIVESGRLSAEETKIATEICLEAGADFIKTSTGMVEVGAELDKIKIFYDIIKSRNSDMKIKASGGIRTIEDIIKFAPYVDRFGVGSGSIDNMMGQGSGESAY
jgi:deoxyribose-phosphate aldolase